MSPRAASLPNLEKARPRRGYAPTLGWYLARWWLVILCLTLLALGSFIALINALEAMRQAGESTVNTSEAALMSLLRLPDMLLQLLPFAILIGTLVWLHGLNGRSELVAIRAAGLPVRRFLVAPLVTCLLVGIAALAIGNPVAATLLKRHEAWEAASFPGKAQGVLTPAGSLWLRQDLSTPQGVMSVFLYGGKVAAQGTQLNPVTAFVFDSSNTLVSRFDAASARLQPGAWLLQDVLQLKPNRQVVSETAVRLPTPLTATELAASLNPPPTLNVWELQRLVNVLQQNGWPSGAHRVALNNLLVLPLLGVVMLLLAVPFGLRHARVGGVVAKTALGLALGFGFFVLRNWAGAYAVAGRLDPTLAALVPVAVGLLLALFLFIWLREE